MSIQSTSAIRSGERLLVIGNPEEVHVGAHFMRAAEQAGLDAVLVDTRIAHGGMRWLNKAFSIAGRPPVNVARFNKEVIRIARQFRPKCCVSAGLLPVARSTLEILAQLGVKTCAYLTDDPFSPVRRAGWVLPTLPYYHHLFTPRRANMLELSQLGARHVSYLPFGYCPSLHFPYDGPRDEDLSSDIVFVGGGDADRVPFMAALIRSGLRVALFGGRWEQFPETRRCARGLADPEMVRKAIAGAKISLCLVRRSNRDGHCMRTFEVPAMRGCMLAEDTGEHRDLLGEEGSAVRYFRNVNEMLAKVQLLLQSESERNRLSTAGWNRIRAGGNSYLDRLLLIVGAT